MEHSQFTISYYMGEEYDRPELKENHDSIEAAARWCQKNYIPLSVVQITEWNIEGEYDYQGIPEIVTSCNLEEAFESNTKSLPI